MVNPSILLPIAWLNSCVCEPSDLMVLHMRFDIVSIL